MSEIPHVIASTAAGHLLADGTIIPHAARAPHFSSSAFEREARRLSPFSLRNIGQMHELAQTEADRLAVAHAFLESRVGVGHLFVRRGDLTRPQCLAVQAQYATEAETARDKARAYGQLAEELVEGLTVRQLWAAQQFQKSQTTS